jgi:hypothetical protein
VFDFQERFLVPKDSEDEDVKHAEVTEKLQLLLQIICNKYILAKSGVNPTTVSYNANVVKIYNAALFRTIFSTVKTL